MLKISLVIGQANQTNQCAIRKVFEKKSIQDFLSSKISTTLEMEKFPKIKH